MFADIGVGIVWGSTRGIGLLAEEGEAKRWPTHS